MKLASLATIALALLGVSRAAEASERKVRGQAFKAVQQAAKEHLPAAENQIACADLGTSDRLCWTRRLIARPGSDWGIQGVGTVFDEKRTALTNLQFGCQNLAAVRGQLRAFKAKHKPSLIQRVQLCLLERKLANLDATAASHREALRQTKPIWDQQMSLFRDVKPGQKRVFEAVLADQPQDQPVIDQHLGAYIQGKYSR